MSYFVLGTGGTVLRVLSRIEFVWDFENDSIFSVVTPGRCYEEGEMSLRWAKAAFVILLTCGL